MAYEVLKAIKQKTSKCLPIIIVVEHMISIKWLFLNDFIGSHLRAISMIHNPDMNEDGILIGLSQVAGETHCNCGQQIFKVIIWNHFRVLNILPVSTDREL